MTQTVFWSWQSDTPKRETRDVIHDALIGALAELAVDLEEAQRAEVDQGAKGIDGMELIAKKILDKIDKPSVFVADISAIAAIGQHSDRKYLPNPNVMLELGYAHRALGRSRLIPVFNTAFGPPRHEDLPFDLRHMSGSILFTLAEGASNADLRRERAVLQKQLRARLGGMLAKPRAEQGVPTPQWHAALVEDPSIWEEAYNPLPVACRHGGQIDVIVALAPRLFVRILPTEQGAAPRARDGLFPDSQNCLRPIGGGGDMIAGRTSKGGHVCFESVGEDRTTRSLARWYQDNGEIWAISTWGFYGQSEHPHFAYDEMIRDLAVWIPRAIRTSQAAGATGPFDIVLGAVGLRNVQWFLSRPSPGSRPFLGLDDVVTCENAISDDSHDAALEVVCDFVNKLTDNFGVPGLMREQVTTLAGEG